MKHSKLLLLVASSLALHAQSFPLGGRRIQIHGFFSQGFAWSDQNNYLTMKTSAGSFAFTDGGVNLSTSITDKFRVGAQGYVRNIGHLGQGHLTLDWAYGDYRFATWFGVRGGRIKTVLGLHNDTQDVDALHTWAILPQSMYPVDLRSLTIAHNGGDVYGEMAVKRLGRFSYVGYAGTAPKDRTSGLYYGMQQRKIDLNDDSNHLFGADFRWATPLQGLVGGLSYLNQQTTAEGTILSGGKYLPYSEKSRVNSTLSYYVQYGFHGVQLEGEYRRNPSDLNGANIPNKRRNRDARGWYASASYRVSKLFEVGSYYSAFIPDWRAADWSLPENHIRDAVAAVRMDLTRHLVLKVEGHMMDGYGATTSFRGFYKGDQPSGEPLPTTNMAVIRLGYSF